MFLKFMKDFSKKNVKIWKFLFLNTYITTLKVWNFS